MIVNDQRGNETSSNVGQVSNFSIQADAKAFSVLSATLYKNPIRAIVRELSCNAIDAHKEAGNPNPFQIGLPNAFGSDFWVEDFGVGMTTEMVEKIYTTYFASTKDQSNDAIGGFGIGSKTPFAYTTQFSVRSRKDGKETTALCFLNDARIPQFKVVSVLDTKEGNGTKVSFVVRERDFDRFVQETITTCLFLEKMPAIVAGRDEFEESLPYHNSRKISAVEFDSCREQIGAGIIDEMTRSVLNRTFGSDPIIVMGNVPYRFDCDEVFADVEGYKQGTTQRKVQRYYENKRIFHCELGEITMQPSREVLSYDDKTKARLRKMFSGDFDTFIAKIRGTKKIGELTALLGEQSDEASLFADFGFRDSSESFDSRSFRKMFGVDDAVIKELTDKKEAMRNFSFVVNNRHDGKKPSKAVNLPGFLKLSQKGGFKTLQGEVARIKYEIKRDYSVSVIQAYLKAEELLVVSQAEFAGLIDDKKSDKDDYRTWNNTKKAVVQHFETLRRAGKTEIILASETTITKLKKFGFDCSKIKKFYEVDKFVYKFARTAKNPFEGLERSTVKIVYNSSAKAAGMKEGETMEFGEVVKKLNGANLLWTFGNSNDYQCRRGYGYLEINMDFDPKSAKAISQESTRYANFDTRAVTAIRTIKESMRNTGSVATSFATDVGKCDFDDCVVVKVAYNDGKRAKLWKDLSKEAFGTFRKEIKEVAEYANVKKQAISNAKNMRNFLMILEKLRKAATGPSDFVNIVSKYEGIDGALENAIDRVGGYFRMTSTDDVEDDRKLLYSEYPMLRYMPYYNDEASKDFVEYVIMVDDMAHRQPRLVAPEGAAYTAEVKKSKVA
jgi:hypothetical protein